MAAVIATTMTATAMNAILSQGSSSWGGLGA